MGIFRIILAISVIIGHAGEPLGNYWGFGAFYAVNLFFIISGFYMAFILNEKYPNKNFNNIFLKNRFYRIFPTYYICLLIALISGYLTGKLNVLWSIIKTSDISVIFYIFLSNLTIFGQDLSYIFRIGHLGNTQNGLSPIDMSLNPPAWSIAVELMFYIIAPLILRSKKKTVLFLIFGIFYSIIIKYINYPINYISFMHSSVDLTKMQYYFFPSSILFFSLGALSYHFIYKKIIFNKEHFSFTNYVFSLLIIGLLSMTTTIIPAYQIIFYIISIPTLFFLTKNNKFDRTLGELSYAIYLLHYPILMVVKKFGPYSISTFHINNIYIATILTILFSILIYVLIEKPLDNFKQRNNA